MFCFCFCQCRIIFKHRGVYLETEVFYSETEQGHNWFCIHMYLQHNYFKIKRRKGSCNIKQLMKYLCSDHLAYDQVQNVCRHFIRDCHDNFIGGRYGIGRNKSSILAPTGAQGMLISVCPFVWHKVSKSTHLHHSGSDLGLQEDFKRSSIAF